MVRAWVGEETRLEREFNLQQMRISKGEFEELF